MSNSPLGLPTITSALKSIGPYLQRAEELRTKDPIMTYWCTYYAAQLGLSLKAKDTNSGHFLFEILNVLERMKEEIGLNDAVDVESASSAYVENFALKVFGVADHEDRAGKATRATAKKFLAASNFLEVTRIFPKTEGSELIEGKIRYAKWKAGDIAKAFREGRAPTPGPPVSETPEILGITAPPETPDLSESTKASAKSAPSLDSQEESSIPPTQNSLAFLGGHFAGDGEVTPGKWSTVATPGNDSMINTPSAPDYATEPTSDDLTTSFSYFEGPSGSQVTHRSDNGSPSTNIERYSSDTFSSIPPPVLPTTPILPPPDIPVTVAPSAPPLPPVTPVSQTYVASLPSRPAIVARATEIEATPELISKTQKHCRFAMSALDYEDIAQARKELRAALALLGG